MIKTGKIVIAAALAVVTSAIVFSALFFTGCGAKGYFEEPGDAMYVTSAQEVTELKGCTFQNYVVKDVAIVTRQGQSGTEYGLYDFDKRTFLSPLATGEITYEGGLFLRTETSDTATTYRLYSCTQSVGAPTQDVPDVYQISRKYVRADVEETTYFVNRLTGDYTIAENRTAKYIAERCVYETDKYLVTEGSKTGTFEYYDSGTFEYVRTIDSTRVMPAYDYFLGAYVLSNGDVVVQAAVPTWEGNKDADIIMSSGYSVLAYDIVTHIVDADSGKHNEKEVNFIINDVSNAATSVSFEDKWDCDNVALVSMIDEDTRMQSGVSTLVALSDSLKIKYDFSELTGSSIGSISTISYLGNGKFYADGNIYDNGGKLLAVNVNIISGGKYFYKTFSDGTTRVYETRHINEKYSFDTSDVAIYGYGDSFIAYDKSRNTVNVYFENGNVQGFSCTSFSATYLSGYGLFSLTVNSNTENKLYAVGENNVTELFTFAGSIVDISEFTDDSGNYAGYIVSAGSGSDTSVYILSAA